MENEITEAKDEKSGEQSSRTQGWSIVVVVIVVWLLGTHKAPKSYMYTTVMKVSSGEIKLHLSFLSIASFVAVS